MVAAGLCPAALGVDGGGKFLFFLFLLRAQMLWFFFIIYLIILRHRLSFCQEYLECHAIAFLPLLLVFCPDYSLLIDRV